MKRNGGGFIKKLEKGDWFTLFIPKRCPVLGVHWVNLSINTTLSLWKGFAIDRNLY